MGINYTVVESYFLNGDLDFAYMYYNRRREELIVPVEIGLPKSTTSDYIETRAKVFALFSDNKNIFDHYHLCDIYGEIMERIIRNDIPENELKNSKIYHYTFKSCDNLKFSILILGNDDKLYTKYIVTSKTLIPF